MKFAIVIGKVGGEFYPDPIYENIKQLDKKLEYLAEYREKNNMPRVGYIAEALTEEREAQHNKEWKQWCSMID